MSLVPYKVTAIKKTDPTGNNVLPGASVSIVTPGGSFAQLWDDQSGTIARSNPFQVDSNGERQVWINGGEYTVSVAGGQSWDIKLIGGSDILMIENVTALSSVAPIVGQVYYIKEYNAGTGKGGGALIAKSGSITPDNLNTFSSGTAGIYFERINNYQVLPEQAGANLDGVNSDNTAILKCSNKTKSIVINGPAVNTLNIQQHADVIYRGDGDFVNDPYRKFVIGDRFRSDALNCADFIATKHAKLSCSVSRPKIILVGNSLSTYAANTTSRGDVFAEILKTTLNNQFPRGIEFLNYSIAGTSWTDLFTDYSGDGLPWFTTPGTWLSKVDAQNPTMVVFFFGMNDSASISFSGVKNAIDAVEAFAPKPDILIVNQYPPTPTSDNALPDPKATMQGRDAACGFMRSYAKYRNVGLLDVHRKYCMSLDGFDPTSTVSLEPVSVTGVQVGENWSYTLPMQCSDWVVWPRWNDSDTGWTIVCKTGTHPQDQVNIARSGANLAITPYSQGQAWLGTVLVPYTFANADGLHFAVEKKGDILSIYKVNAPFFGSQGEPIFWTKLVSNGGIYDATVDSIGFQLAACEIGISEFVRNMPSIKYSEMWGAEDASTKYGGSGWNHPSHYIAGHVYREIVQSTIFYQHVDLFGQVDVPSGTGNVQVFFDVPELSQNYLIFLTTADGDIDMSKHVQFRDFSNFRVYFNSPPTGVDCKMQWLLKRMY